eukprot:Plantae.Rhodophyta-Rhodochaete_pulchella.ctg12067.p1 GENE.Plantae.Rhodophyta-Rhodochaete_pulchella.ctg12067~~Plantae.Rhodophyta-Rhodochaete_pulchella.ctg12067.p1  ORF type:complete len:282 (+),score=15.38 Plantae.Rhodophyta-Rhodochaete_pulchella.ctg12067:74-919(+)
MLRLLSLARRRVPWHAVRALSSVAPAASSVTPTLFPSSAAAEWNPSQSRRVGLLARKVGMMNLWESDGLRITTTVLCVDRCHVLQVKPPQPNQRDNRMYHIQVGAGPKRPYQVAKPQRYHFAMAGVEPKHKCVEFPVTPDALLKVGTEVTAGHFVAGQYVDVTGISVGKGFQGPMKRWGFGGLPASHGVSKAHRSHGSTGNRTEPGRVFKGKKMAGRMGGKRRTVQSLLVVRTDVPRNLIFVRGHVPGNPGNWVRVFDARRKESSQPVLPPLPTCNEQLER